MEVFRWLLVFVVLAFFVSLHLSVVAAQDDVDDDLRVEDEETKGDATKPDEDEDEYEEDDGELKQHSDVRTVVYFPDFVDKKFHVGSKVNTLIGFNNKGDSGFNVTAIGAYFHSPYDYSYYIQNFSIKEVGVTLAGHWQVTFEYVFAPDKGLEPLDYWLSGWILYNSTDGREYLSTWYNGTVQLVEKETEFDIRRVFSYFLLASAIGLVIYVVINFSQGSGKKKRERRPISERTAKAESTAEDWGVQDLVYTPAEKARRAGSRKAKKPKSQSQKAKSPGAADTPKDS